MIWVAVLVDLLILGLFFLYLWKFHKDCENSKIYMKIITWVGTPLAFALMMYGGFGMVKGIMDPKYESISWMIAFCSGPCFCLIIAICANFEVEYERRLRKMYGGGI